MQSVKQIELALAGWWTLYPGKTWGSRWLSRRDKRPGFLNGGGFKPRRTHKEKR